LAQLRLARTPGLGPVGYRKLLHKHGGAEAVVDSFREWARKEMALPSPDAVRREADAVAKMGGSLILWGQPDYPAALAELPDPPLALTVLGDISALGKRQVGLVGNRNASAAGLAWTKDLARQLSARGVVVTSGLARGIDTVAHEGALAGGAPTVAVVAGGVDHVYPPENKDLRQRIIASGAVISEQPLGMAPMAQLFARRNRIIAGLSVGVVVSEASRHSGSLITAQCALDYGREVWAVPGAPSDPRAGGPNWLLKNGATLVESAEDILGSLPATPAPYVPRLREQPSLLDEAREDEEGLEEPMSARGKVYALLSAQPVSNDELVRASGFHEVDLTGLLVEMELDGHAVREADGRWRRG
jgi:DNA processing protein